MQLQGSSAATRLFAQLKMAKADHRAIEELSALSLSLTAPNALVRVLTNH